MVSDLQALVGDGNGADTVRGTLDASPRRGVSAAVVIGVGGSGIQTVARVRSAVRAHRPDQTARETIQFLGIDAVDETKQDPPLPPGVRLGSGEFLNLTETSFDASTYVRSQLQADKLLATWWDPDYTVPAGSLTDGLKRERMLGRLAFYKESTRVTAEVARAMNAAIDIGELVERGNAGGSDTPTVPVYIACSASGGTGSAGFLEVVFDIWKAARRRGLMPKIYAFLFLPGAFETAVLKTPNGAIATEAQRANAFAFFRELDHFLAHGSHFAAQMGQDVRRGGPEIGDRQLLHQAYLLDGIMQGIGAINNVTDLYEIAAESIFQFLLTDAGRPLMGVQAANTDQALGELDRWDKPRRYCSLGIARVLFPGDTYRTHLKMRYADWIIDDSFLNRPDNLVEYVRDHPSMQALEDRIPALAAGVRQYEPEEEVADFLDLADHIPSNLAANPTPEEAAKFRNRIELESPDVIKSMQRTLTAHAQDQARTIERDVVERVLTSGEGLAFSLEVLRRVRRTLERLLRAADAGGNAAAAASAESEGDVGRLMEQLQKAAARRLHEKVLAGVGSLIGKARTVDDVVKELGPAMQAWARAIHDQQLSDSETAFMRGLLTRMIELRAELERAQSRLRQISDLARRHWEHDELIGKDAGPLATSTLIPGDVLPEVEDSKFAKRWFDEIAREHGDKLTGDALREFVERWGREGVNRGFFSLGAEEPDERRKAERTLMDALERDAEDRALHTLDESNQRTARLPATLEVAANEADETQRLNEGVRSLEELSRHVCWSWDQGRFVPTRGDDDATRHSDARPAVTSVILYDPSSAELVKRHVSGSSGQVTMDDPERMIALSVEWAVPLHTLHCVDQWRVDYDRVQAIARSRPGGIPPAHIDSRWAKALEPLVPEYGERGRTAKVAAKAFVFGKMLEAERKTASSAQRGDRTTGPLAALFKSGVREDVVAPIIRHSTEDRWVGRLLDVVNDDYITVRKDELDLGRTWSELLFELAEEASLLRSIDSVVAFAVREVGSEDVAEVAASQAEAFAKVTKQRRLSKADRDAAAAIAEGLLDFHDDLETRIAAG